MMEAIKDQKEVLINLRSEIHISEMRLKETSRMTEEMEMIRNEAENERLIAETETRRIDSEKEEVEIEIKRLEEAKASTKQSLESLQVEVGRLRQEMEENGDEMIRYGEIIIRFYKVNYFFRLNSGLAPLEKDVSTKNLELSKIERNLAEKIGKLKAVQQKIAASSKLLK